MSRLKDDVVNKAIELTRRYRPIQIDRDGAIIECPKSWNNVPQEDFVMLRELCWSIQNLIYGEKNNNAS